MGWTIRGSISGQGKRSFYSPKRPDQLWGPEGILLNWCQQQFSRD